MELINHDAIIIPVVKLVTEATKLFGFHLAIMVLFQELDIRKLLMKTAMKKCLWIHFQEWSQLTK